MHICYCLIEINSKDEINSSWKKWVWKSVLIGSGELTIGYRKERFTPNVVKCWSRLPRETLEPPALEMLKTCLAMTLERVGPGTSRGSFQSKCFMILCCFVDDPYLKHNFSCLILQFMIVKCKGKAVLSDSKFSNVKNPSPDCFGAVFFGFSWGNTHKKTENLISSH